MYADSDQENGYENTVNSFNKAKKDGQHTPDHPYGIYFGDKESVFLNYSVRNDYFSSP